MISQQVAGTAESAEVEESLAEEYDLPVLVGRTTQRVAYARAMAEGVSVLDYEPDGKAADEVRMIADEVLDALTIDHRHGQTTQSKPDRRRTPTPTPRR